MRARSIVLVATLTAVAMLFPAIATGLGGICNANMLTAGQCCCDDGDSVDQAPDAPTVASACCCELRQAPADTGTAVAAALMTGADHAPDVAATTAYYTVGRPLGRAAVVRVQSRGPPPLRTLLAQRTAMIC